ncbi:hypothetical protein Glove_41g34 [Diversispora epigaea]|uniref:Alkaline phosphatase n=1 Tax=Diversispora epigaea TaxID=1348612 RepID=A0A397JFC9_9GLOM|nr:hypothetical protein Glove_41g34 [Diversispora epigaea]
MSSSHSSHPEDEERAGLLSGSEPGRKNARNKLLVIILGVIGISLIVIGLTAIWADQKLPIKRNVILMISDGFGPASETFAREYYQYVNDLKYNYMTPLDEILVGSSRTRSSDSLVTDSAAGATAFSCAKKTYNGAIGVDPDKFPCGTILEAAKAIGMVTGLVATSRITHATPASFSAHVVLRAMEDSIALQQVGNYPLGKQVDLMFGGGKCYFLPNTSSGSCRSDERNLLQEAEEGGFKNLLTRNEFDVIDTSSVKLPLMGLFTLDHMSYEIDRDQNVEPSLKEMAKKALDILESNNDKGFFLMIEGSRIDMAAHDNDPGTHVHEILAYHETISVVRKFVDEHPGTVLISVSDHETGGLSLARQTAPNYPQYRWFPDVISRIKNSSYILATQLRSYWDDDRISFINKTILNDGLGINDFTQDDLDYLNQNLTKQSYIDYLANLTSWRAELGWATHGHSSVDVNLYAYGMNIEALRGNHENTDIGEFIKNYLNLDLDDITLKLNSNNASFHLSNVNISNYNADHLEHYHHLH